MITKDRQTVSN